ncbi:hypothetical protein V6N13_098945 [Hibiscus sabdariffa]|uniref:Uncharacterized protein n=1 Tax=Hibiscus sabdariffa TaxID=183260 RepID=A0ABR2P9P2_9ROSI
MDKKSIIVVLLGIISVITGFAAEFTRVKASQVDVDDYGRCWYPSSPALFFGIASAATLSIAKIIINLATDFFCCKARAAQSHISSNRTEPLCLYFVFSITYIIAMGLLITGVKLNERHDDAVVKNGYYYCYVIRPGVFAAGAVMAALSCIFGVIYYRILNSRGKDAGNEGGNGIAMAQPQFPVDNPDFVNMKRQLS